MIVVRPCQAWAVLRQSFRLICRVLYRHRPKSEFNSGNVGMPGIEQDGPSLGSSPLKLRPVCAFKAVFLGILQPVENCKVALCRRGFHSNFFPAKGRANAAFFQGRRPDQIID